MPRVVSDETRSNMPEHMFPTRTPLSEEAARMVQPLPSLVTEVGGRFGH